MDRLQKSFPSAKNSGYITSFGFSGLFDEMAADADLYGMLPSRQISRHRPLFARRGIAHHATRITARLLISSATPRPAPRASRSLLPSSAGRDTSGHDIAIRDTAALSLHYAMRFDARLSRLRTPRWRAIFRRIFARSGELAITRASFLLDAMRWRARLRAAPIHALHFAGSLFTSVTPICRLAPLPRHGAMPPYILPPASLSCEFLWLHLRCALSRWPHFHVD